MNKFVRFSIWLIFLVAILVLVLAVKMPNDITITRSITIKAPKETVMGQVVRFSNWANWSILLLSDSTAKITYAGEDGKVGSSLTWKGDDGKIGAGKVTSESVSADSFHYSFNVTEPAAFLADGSISVADSGIYSNVTWHFHKHFPFFANAVLVVLDFEKYISADLSNSLSNLKDYIEHTPEPIVEIKETDHGACTLAGIRDTLHWSDISTFFDDTYSLFNKVPQSKVVGNHSGVYYVWDTATRSADVMAAVSVADTDIPVNGLIYLQLPASRAFMAVHRGGYSSMQHTHEALAKYVVLKGQVQWLVVEEYPVYPGNEPDSNKWVTDIYYLLQ